jgi:hypothetical protein
MGTLALETSMPLYLFRAQHLDLIKRDCEYTTDKILKGQIIQRTSVKPYNDDFNEAVALATETEANAAILRSYETVLKPPVRNTATVALVANPNASFHDCRTLTVGLDETLMQTHVPSTFTPLHHIAIINPILNPPAGQGNHVCNTPVPRGTTHIK